MKKTLAFLLALMLMTGALLSAVAETDALLSWEGFELRPLHYEVRKREADDSSLKIFMRVINNTDKEIYLRISSANIDGTSVEGIGITNCKPHTDTGEDSLEYFLFKSDGSGDACIQNPGVVSMILDVVDKGTYDLMYREAVTLDLAGLPSEVKEAPTSTPMPEYHTLSQGSKGEEVRRLQQRLIDLGYLNDKADGSYGPKTAAAVREFCSQNGLYVDGTATPEMQRLLFSSSAKAYSEPWIPLEIGQRTEWRDLRADTFSFRVQVVNNSKTRTVRGFEVEYYPTDVWGNRLLGDAITRKFTTTLTVKPGKTAYSLWASVGANFYNVDQINMAITKIVFDDGEVREDPDPVIYTCSLH